MESGQIKVQQLVFGATPSKLWPWYNSLVVLLWFVLVDTSNRYQANLIHTKCMKS